MNIEAIFKDQLDINIFDKNFYQKLLEEIRKVKKLTNKRNKSF